MANQGPFFPGGSSLRPYPGLMLNYFLRLPQIDVTIKQEKEEFKP